MNIQQIENRKKLFIVYNRAMKAVRTSELVNKDKLTMRVKSAFSILLHNDYYQAEKAAYQPTKWSCGCPDYIYRLRHKRGYEGACKHMIAERLKINMSLLQYKQLDFFKLI